MKSLQNKILESTDRVEGQQYYLVSYENHGETLKQYIRYDASKEITTKMMRAWITSKGGTFKSLRKVKDDRDIYICYPISDKLYAEMCQ